MSTHYEFTVSPEGKIPIVLPEEYRGKTCTLDLSDSESPSRADIQKMRLSMDRRDFYRHKPLVEIVKEQGIKPIRSMEDLRPKESIWESDEEFFEFLEAMGKDVENYLSIYPHE